ncbi:MAG: deoxynucleoside kinase [Candidatus Micrarchaeota archaeon]|nr:deoxynucleoside kinase [Candidatus Micrarchaeota archaeon]MCX8154751.1 deoxynucleoside kinase [Candidatus Micrarchaeota archaeon]
MRIAVEGIDGAGKTTISGKLASIYGLEYLKFPRYEFIPVIKRHLMGEKILDDRTTTLLFLADIIDGTLGKRSYVADRLFFSTIAYSRMDTSRLIEIIDTLQIEYPDYVIYLDIDIDTALSRISKKREITNYDRDIDLLRRVSDRYREIFRNQMILSRTNVLRLDARLPIDNIIQQIQRSIEV